MRFTTLSPVDDATIQPTASRAAPDVARVRRLHITLVVAGTLGPLLFAPVTTLSLELGEASIKSGLGQSLLVQIPYRLASNEQLSPTCISLVPTAQAANALPTYTQARRISLSATHIEIFDDRSVREPLIGINISVHCVTAPHFVRSYQLFVDPPAPMPVNLSDGPSVASEQATIGASVSQPYLADRASETVTPTAATMPPLSTPSTATTRADPSPRARGQAGGDLVQGQMYRVVRGDTLSGIAARVADRPATIQITAEAIFAANPDAFTRGNRDLIKQGRSLTVPIMTPAPAMPAVFADAPPASSAAPQTEPPAVVPVPVLPPSTMQPGLNDAPSASTPAAVEPLPTSGAVVEPSTALDAGLKRADVATESASVTTFAMKWIALLAVGVVGLLSAPWVFVRRRQQRTRVRLQEQRPRRLVEPMAGIEVIEGAPARASANDTTASTRGEGVEAVSSTVLPADLENLAVTFSPTDAVDLNVGAAVVMNERVDWFAARAVAPVVDAASDATIEENDTTARMPTSDVVATARQQPPHATPHGPTAPMDDEQMTLTIVEMDMLREDYEAQHTLTQHTSQALRDAVADLNDTKAARAANGTVELTQQLHPETEDSTARLPTARVRMR
jgi:hypothetical protein